MEGERQAREDRGKDTFARDTGGRKTSKRGQRQDTFARYSVSISLYANILYLEANAVKQFV